MITKESAPVGWAGLMYELEDAQEHLAELISEMNNEADFDEVNFRIGLAHVFSHLNRAWYRRNKDESLEGAEWVCASGFPTDMDPARGG